MALLDDRGGGTSTQTTTQPAPKPGDVRSSTITLSDGRVINVLERYEATGVDPATMQTTYGWVSFGSPIFPESGGGGGSSGSYASSSAAQEDQQAFQAEQDRLAREFQAEQNRLQQEAAERQSRLNALTDLITNFATNQQKARDLLFQLGPDPFKFAAASQGMATRGVTPQQAYSNELSQFSSIPLPAVNPNATTADINSTIASMTGGTGIVPGLPQGPSGFGMAGGGEASWASFGPMPTRIRVGELGPETLEVSNQGFRVIPNGMMPADMGAAEGFDQSSLAPSLSSLYRTLGFSTPPDLYKQDNPMSYNTLQNFGFSPSLVRTPNGAIFWRGPEGAYHGITSWDTFQKEGFNYNDVVNVPNLEGFKEGGFFQPGQSSSIPQSTPPFGPFGGVIHTTGGYLLPAPYRVANSLKMLKETNPSVYATILSGYNDAGIPSDFVESQIDSATVHGYTPSVARRLIGFR